MNDQAPAVIRDETMLYREPTDGSDEQQISEIWGKKLETRVVDASEVPEMLAAGWVRNPLHIDHPPKPEEAAGFEPANAGLREDVVSARAIADEAIARLAEAELKIERLEADLSAATELADAESKAKDAALARVAELEAAPKPKLGIKAGDKPA